MIYHRIIFKCDECSDEKEVKIPLHVDDVTVSSELPNNWTRINNKIYCDKHKIVIAQNPDKIDLTSESFHDGVNGAMGLVGKDD